MPMKCGGFSTKGWKVGDVAIDYCNAYLKWLPNQPRARFNGHEVHEPPETGFRQRLSIKPLIESR